MEEPDDIMPFRERLLEVLVALNVSASRLADQIEVTRQSVHNFLKGNTSPGLQVLEKICEFDPRISAEYLLRGIGQPLKEASVDTESLYQIQELQRRLDTQVYNQLESLRYQNDLLVRQNDELLKRLLSMPMFNETSKA